MPQPTRSGLLPTAQVFLDLSPPNSCRAGDQLVWSSVVGGKVETFDSEPGATTKRRIEVALVRLLLQPVALRLLGPHAWWMPAWLDRLLPSLGLSHGMRG